MAFRSDFSAITGATFAQRYDLNTPPPLITQNYSYGNKDYTSFAAAQRANPNMQIISGPPSAQALADQASLMQGRQYVDRLTSGSSFGSIAVGVANTAGASQRTQDLVYGLGNSADGFLMVAGGVRGAQIPGISNQRDLNVINGYNGINGNSKLSPRTAYLYELQTTGGKFLKYGISQNPDMRYSNRFMEDKRIKPIASGTRSDMLTVERQMVTANPGPMNNEPWAVKARLGTGQ